MKKGYLSQYFEGVAIKNLSAVEADILTSNQHEFNGVEGLRNILGEPDGKVKYPATFMYLTDHDDEPIIEDGFLTWYDARQKARIERGVMRYEYRLYFPTNQVSQLANAGDILVIAKRPDDTLLAIVAEVETTIARQILWLFGFSDLPHPGFSVREELETEQDRIEFASRFILESIGVTVQVSEETWLDEILGKFNGTFPTSREFSSFARLTLPDVSPQDGQDAALMAWMEREEILFRTLEKHLIGERLSQGFDGDVDGFISFSLSVQNRRKSRAGLALENHLEILFGECGIRYTRTPKTENKSKPDFIFPGIEEYRTSEYDPLYLTMLGVKSSCKDRWRQVLAEADRIEQKHLLTLEAAISENQTDEMAAKNLQLVLPEELHDTYSEAQKPRLMNVSQFIELVRKRQP
ncbi:MULTISPECIES: type II restriction endonuclease [Nitrosomonas]|uniref:type II restriction endonuclease n=1 Tax=Nitrosomonas TaxID=914 RepID=UPI0008AE9873|nr:type II restriction endonuclease [Nitrosomonas eutropha]MXS81379.1 restriction endonuclease [Nitrosomonas sp. GH22]SEJ31644.1 EcoRII C terminal [Nitrosomonas eutropha]